MTDCLSYSADSCPFAIQAFQALFATQSCCGLSEAKHTSPGVSQGFSRYQADSWGDWFLNAQLRQLTRGNGPHAGHPPELHAPLGVPGKAAQPAQGGAVQAADAGKAPVAGHAAHGPERVKESSGRLQGLGAGLGRG